MAERKKQDSIPPSKRKGSVDDRRDSPRIAMQFLVRDVGLPHGEWEEREGDLSLGGIYWKGKTAPHGTEVDVRFRLPGVPKEIRCRGEILRVKAAGATIDFHVRFTELDVQSELAIAKALDDWLAERK
ncbi:MAG: PilZ domain-containing protein [Myxococcota bacterium]